MMVGASASTVKTTTIFSMVISWRGFEGALKFRLTVGMVTSAAVISPVKRAKANKTRIIRKIFTFFCIKA